MCAPSVPRASGRSKLIDATPIGINVRSTVATYANVHDELRKIYARTPDAKALGYKAGDFSYNTGKLRCPTCDGTGSISLDIQFLPDVEITCPDCGGSRYCARMLSGSPVLPRRARPTPCPELMEMSVEEALKACDDLKLVPGPPGYPAKPGPGLPDPGRGHPQPVRRRSPAAEAGQRNGPGPGGHASLSSTSPPSASTRWMCRPCCGCSSGSLTAGPP